MDEEQRGRARLRTTLTTIGVALALLCLAWWLRASSPADEKRASERGAAEPTPQRAAHENTGDTDPLEPSAAEPSAAPETPRETLEQQLRAAEQSPHRLIWQPEDYRPTDTVFDMCDDDQAVLAGLDGQELDEQRYRRGIDCESSKLRYGFVPPGDTLFLVDSYEEAERQLKKASHEASKSPGTLMGTYGPTWRDLGLQLHPAGDGFAVAPASIDSSNGKTRGLFVNTSERVAHDIRVKVGDTVSVHPLSVQPGETAAFELPLELSANELSTLAVEGRFEAEADARRTLLVTGTPGRWSGTREKLREMQPKLDLSNAPDHVMYFETQLWFDNSASHPDVGQQLESQILKDPTVVASALDETGKVLAVIRPDVWTEGEPSQATSMQQDDYISVGFIVPPETVTLVFSAGGSEQ